MFDYLTYNTDTIQEYLLSVLDKVYVPDNLVVSSEEDRLKLEMDIEKLEKKKEKLVDALTEDLISKEIPRYWKFSKCNHFGKRRTAYRIVVAPCMLV